MENRQEQIQKITRDLFARFNERVFSDRKKAEKLQRLHPRFISEYHRKWDEFDEICGKYLRGEIALDDKIMYQLFLDSSEHLEEKISDPETMKKYARDFYVWFMSKTEGL